MKKLTTALTLLGFMLLAVACNKKADFNYFYYNDEDSKLLSEYLNLPLETPFPYTVTFPAHLRNVGLFPRPVEYNKATLGRVLFYDKKLSKDGTIACASCHKQNLGFGDDVAFSKGVSDRSTARNSFALSSVANFSAYYGTDLNGFTAIRFFWDNRAETVAEQSRGSLTNPKEMDMDMHAVAATVAAQPYYKPLFEKAFGSFDVTEDLVLEAIANFINAMGSYDSKFDQNANNSAIDYSNNTYVFAANFTTSFTAAENRGKQVYNTYCASCHSGNMGRPLLQLANNGLDLNTADDEGVGAISGIAAENGTFKVPTLRNIVYSAPYMHDGRFKTLDEVLEHYSSGVQNHPNLSANLKTANGEPLKMNFSQEQRQDLIAFLNTLSDDHQRTDEQFSNPFKQ
jgi:cytochrome c peroxidase